MIAADPADLTTHLYTGRAWLADCETAAARLHLLSPGVKIAAARDLLTDAINEMEKSNEREKVSG